MKRILLFLSFLIIASCGSSKMAVKKYKKGWFDGRQKVWYKNGVKHLDYFYENLELNNEFTRWDTTGKVMENGLFKNNYMDSLWTINLKVPKICQSIIRNNPELNWSKMCLATIDGSVTYNVLLEQVMDKKKCPFRPCVKVIKYGEFN